MPSLHWLKTTVREIAVLIGMTAILTGCSSFNLSPRCDETGPGVQRVLAIPTATGPIDRLRLSRAVTVDNLAETGSSYNARVCTARIAAGELVTTVHFRVRQSEGVRDWYDIEFSAPSDPLLQAIAAKARDTYASGS